MTRNRVLLLVLATVVLGGAAIALADSSSRRVPSGAAADRKPMSKELGEINRRLRATTSVNCRSMGCVNRTLTRLTNDVRRLKKATFQCQRRVDVTSYRGYVYTPDGGNTFFETTALDYTAEGDPASDHVLVYVC